MADSDAPPDLRRRLDRWTRRAEDAVARAVHRPDAFWWLALLTALENTVIPLTVEPVVVPLMLLYRDRAWLLAAAMAAGSILGGIVMYAAGAGLAEALAPLLAIDRGAGEAFAARLEREGFWAIVVFAATPLPYQVATVGAGAAGFPFASFLVAITIGRGTLYAAFALAAVLCGARLAPIVERRRREALAIATLAGVLSVTAILFW